MITTDYGLACEDNAMIANTGYSCKLLALNVGSLGCEASLEDLSPNAELPAEAIGARVADACPETCGYCEECADGCAIWFIGNSLCDEACNNIDCQYDGGDCWSSACQMTSWSSWSSCSVSCNGPGSQTRTRLIAKQATNGGAACGALEDTISGCNANTTCRKFFNWSALIHFSTRLYSIELG